MITFLSLQRKLKYHSAQRAISIHFSSKLYEKYGFRLCKCEIYLALVEFQKV